MGKREVTIEQYTRVLDEHKDEVYEIAFLAWQMPVLHTLVAQAADHPNVQKMGGPTKDLIEQIRWWCREKFREWGFTPEEVEYLDTRMEAAQVRRGAYTLTVSAFEAGAIIGFILNGGERDRAPLSGVWNQLVEIKRRIEKAEGITKEILPDGQLKITDPDGTIIIRPPYPWEIETN